jgi:hypothetical protein
MLTITALRNMQTFVSAGALQTLAVKASGGVVMQDLHVLQELNIIIIIIIIIIHRDVVQAVSG